jgi:ubiquinone/menaquinone biosynthesis C-methylase UbiE
MSPKETDTTTIENNKILQWVPSVECCDTVWEEAYARFETPEQEINKFTARLVKLGIPLLSRELSIVELFCGRGNGLKAFERLGFTNLEGVDLSQSLLEQYNGPAVRYIGDCRHLEFESESKDVIIVQGGLHHLKTLPDDLELVLGEVHRVLKNSGRFIVVEPWMTPFLGFVHWICRRKAIRRLSPKIDALACMIDQEQETYENWLGTPSEITSHLMKYFQVEIMKSGWGKLMFVGLKKTL